jgi:hypothetical protein
MYLGPAFVYLGIAIAAQSVWALILQPVVLTIIRGRAIEPEEAFLEGRFGVDMSGTRQRSGAGHNAASLAMRMSLITPCFLPAMTAVSAAEPLSVCVQSKVRLPTLEQQRNYIARNPRYGSDWADAYFGVAKKYGDDFIQYQAHYQPEASGSLRNDIKNYNGLGETPTETGDCEPPVILLAGLKPVSIDGKAISVTEARGVYSLVSLAAIEEAKRPSQLRLAGSNKILCEDFRRELGFGVDGHPCNDLARKVRGR